MPASGDRTRPSTAAGSVQEQTRVLAHAAISADYFRLDLDAPQIAARVRPGQFVHARLPSSGPQILRRPFSVYQAAGDRITLLYKVVGEGTQRLRELRPGTALDLIGPLGHPFTPTSAGEHPILVAGGYGMAALYLLARSCTAPGTAFAGGRRERDLLCVAEFQELGWTVVVTTEDGSQGECGIVTGPLVRFLDEQAGPAAKRPRLYACGPNPMLAAVARIAAERRIACQISVDMPMCCGVGACLTCVIKLADPGAPHGWVWARTCTEGPVFDAARVLWAALG